MRFDRSAIVSLPATRTEPRRCPLVPWPMIPMIARRVVVLPAPLRPSRVTSSPWPTANSMPCSACDSPYQALRSATSSKSAMTRAHIGFDHLGIGRDGLVIALREDAAAGQYGDDVGEVGDDGQIVLDHQHGAVARCGADERGDPSDILLPEAGHRLVEQRQ